MGLDRGKRKRWGRIWSKDGVKGEDKSEMFGNILRINWGGPTEY